jgi:hypothetical protein
LGTVDDPDCAVCAAVQGKDVDEIVLLSDGSEAGVAVAGIGTLNGNTDRMILCFQ